MLDRGIGRLRPGEKTGYVLRPWYDRANRS